MWGGDGVEVAPKREEICDLSEGINPAFEKKEVGVYFNLKKSGKDAGSGGWKVVGEQRGPRGTRRADFENNDQADVQ